jgi:hypothetical protein
MPASLYATRSVYAANTNTLYVFGGYDGTVLNTTYRYNVGTNTWSTGAPMPGGRYFPNMVYYAATGKIYVIGGFDSTFAESTQTWQYDPVANTWDTTRANIPAAMAGSSAGISGQFIYLAGTWAGGLGSTLHYRYDIVGNAWALMSPIPAAIYAPATGVIGGQIYVTGGGNPSLSAPGQEAPGPKGTRAAAPDVSYTSTYIYDIAGNSWTTGPSTNVAHSFTGGAAIGNRLVIVGGYNGTADTNTVEVSTVTSCVTPTPTPTPFVSISGTVVYCSNPVPGPVPNVTMTRTGTTSGSTLTDASGNYSFTGLPSGGNYTVTPTKAARVPGSPNIDTVDVVATQRHFLLLGTPLTGCRLMAADANGDTLVDTVDVIAIQRFFLGLSTGIANVGKYKFIPVNRPYVGITTNQTGQNYDTLVFGDTASGFVELPDGPSQTTPNDGSSAANGDLAVTVAAIALPEIAVDQTKSNFIARVTTTEIDAKNKLVGFQGDFTFDERVVTFQSEPVQKAGLTSGNWNVSGNVLPGDGPVRTLRISAYSNDFTPLNGSGTLFELKMATVGKPTQSTQLIWAAPPDRFIFIDADLKTLAPGNAAPGSVSSSGRLAGKRE